MMTLTKAELAELLFERLGLLTAREMERPHSVLVASRVLFHVHMPPRPWTPGSAGPTARK